ncbi:CcmD family protein [Longimicrobium sp.]|uniref:CcmD family protein n=1 Tax=Longimicrobium sp. TaxID=2029185 RepID=UPI003B3AF941
MRPIRIVLLALFALLAAPAVGPSLIAQAPAATESAAPTAAPPAAGAPQPGSALSSYTPQRTMRAYTHVFVAFALAWVLLFGYVVFIGRKFRRVEEQVDALARS